MRIELFVLLVFLFTSCGYAPKYDRHITTITEQSDERIPEECTTPSKEDPNATICDEPVQPTVKPGKPRPPVKPTTPKPTPGQYPDPVYPPDYEKEEDPTQQNPTQYPPVQCERNC